MKARSKPLEPFTATVLSSAPMKDFSDVLWGFRGKIAGEKVQVEEVDFEQLMGFRKKLWTGKLSVPKNADPAAWWRRQIEEG